MVALYGFRFRCGIFERRFATRATLFFMMKHRQHCSDKLLSEVVQHVSYDFWIVRLVAIGPWWDRSAMFATISKSGRIRRSTSPRGHAITNDWRISMARAIGGNRATSGSDQRPM